ncbi:hypothetical protein GDO78_019162 [Eleutherodactylus coqui]|uniref:Uncharacterized protein n=1 Tax=Eleutherodactylus coqui TaxID=57060 RepID=A0A8J6EIR7_ELECQ|nr:hypothetical protein GDO78_019162 [Eleutherodactylus coqui]
MDVSHNKGRGRWHNAPTAPPGSQTSRPPPLNYTQIGNQLYGNKNTQDKYLAPGEPRRREGCNALQIWGKTGGGGLFH